MAMTALTSSASVPGFAPSRAELASATFADLPLWMLQRFAMASPDPSRQDILSSIQAVQESAYTIFTDRPVD